MIEYGILIVPEGTGGAKYEMILHDNPNIHRIELTNEVGEDLIKNALKHPTKKGWDIAKVIFEDIGEYVPPQVEETTQE